MLSDLLDVLGLAAGVASAYVITGLGGGLAALCVALMFTARAIEGAGDAAAHRALTRILRAGQRAAVAPVKFAGRTAKRRRKAQVA